jgi:hypothetical protein
MTIVIPEIQENMKKRFFLFLIGCIGTRSFLAYFAKTTNTENLQILAYIALVISFGFMYIFLTDSRKTGIEVFGDKIWWNNLRPIHSIIYFLFAYNVLVLKNKQAWKLLVLDVIIGLISFLYYHYNMGHFSF